MPPALKWSGPQARAMIDARVARLLKQAADVVVNAARRILNVSGIGEKAKGGGVVAATGRKKKIYGAFRSKPGEAPYKQTGRLRGSVASEVDGKQARAGTNVVYGRILELLKDRPWLSTAYKESIPAIRAIFAGADKAP